MNYKIVIRLPAINALYDITLYNYTSSNYYYDESYALTSDDLNIVNESFSNKLSQIKSVFQERVYDLYNRWLRNKKKATCYFCEVFDLHFYYYVDETNKDNPMIMVCYILKPIQKTKRRHRRILHNVEEYRNGRAFCFEMLILAGVLEKDDVQKYEILN